MRTSRGVALNKMLNSMALIATDLPEPVVPATSRCGILDRSATTASPLMSLPSARVNGEAAWSKLFDCTISLKATSSRFSLGISSPITDLPGMISTTRTPMTDSDRARSLDRLVIWFTLTPGAGRISNRVITGPGCTDSTSISIPKSSSFNSSCCDIACSADLL